MSDSMTLIALAGTGHVLGALTQTAPGDDPEPADLVGESLPVKRATNLGVDYTLYVPSAMLEVKSAPYDPAVVANPQAYAINGGGPIKLVMPQPPDPAPPNPLVLEEQVLTVSGFPVEADIKVFISKKNSESSTSFVVDGTLEFDQNGDPNALFPLTSPPSEPGSPGTGATLEGGETYGMLLAVEGVPLFLAEGTP